MYQQPATLFATRYFSALNEIPAQRVAQHLQTCFGMHPISEDLAHSQAQIRCCFRPHQVQVFTQPTAGVIPATVLSSSFMGHAEQLRLQLDPETIILAQVSPAQTGYHQQVYVTVDLQQCFFFAQDSQPAAHPATTAEVANAF